jgi:hypothetical protein
MINPLRIANPRKNPIEYLQINLEGILAMHKASVDFLMMPSMKGNFSKNPLTI